MNDVDILGAHLMDLFFLLVGIYAQTTANTLTVIRVGVSLIYDPVNVIIRNHSPVVCIEWEQTTC